jgi:hypothetical protein
MAMVLYPERPGTTRLVWRIRLRGYAWSSPLIFAQLFTDLCDFIAVRQVLTGIKSRVEGSSTKPKFLYTELLMWVAMFVGFLVAVVALVVRREWLGPFLLAVLIGSNTVVCVLLRPRLLVDIIEVLVVASAEVVLLRRPERKSMVSVHV